MKKINFLSLVALLFILVSCVTNVPMNAEYFQKPSKVGIFVNVNDPQKFREGSQGLLDLAVTSGDKYQPLLDHVNKEIKFKNELIDIYSETLKTRGKEVVVIDEKFDPKTAEKFKGNKEESKKYYNYDMRYLKEKYGVDDVVFVNVNWGAMISYYSMVETGRAGYAYVSNRVINLKDNSLYFANDNPQTEIIKGKWNTAPDFANAKGRIEQAVKKAIEVERNVFK